MIELFRLRISAIISIESSLLVSKLHSRYPRTWEHDAISIQILPTFAIPSVNAPLPSYSNILSAAAARTRPFHVRFSRAFKKARGGAFLYIESTDDLRALQALLRAEIMQMPEPPFLPANAPPRLLVSRFNSAEYPYDSGMKFLQRAAGIHTIKDLGSVRIEGLRWSTMELWKAPIGESFEDFRFSEME